MSYPNSNKSMHKCSSKTVSLLLTVLVVLAVIPLVQDSFAQEEQVKEFTSKGIDWILQNIYRAIDEVVEKIDLSNENPLNTTNNEKHEVSEAGKKVIGDLVQTSKDSHKLTEGIVKVILPFEINPLYLFLIVGAVTGLLMIKKGRKLIKWIIMGVLVIIGIIAALAVFGIISFGGFS